MTGRIFRSVFSVAIIVLIASLAIATGFVYGYYNNSQTERLKEELSLARVGVENTGADYFANFNSTVFRFTLIASDGTVLYDSEAESENMGNHLDREEIKEALSGGKGSSARYSSTLTERTFYEAVLLDDGRVLRISTTQVTVGALVIGMLPPICAIVILSAIFALILSKRAAKSIVKPLETLDLDDPENNDTYDELTPLLSRLNVQHKQIERQLNELRRKSDEFRLITASMSEGLVLIDKKGAVLSINPAAQKLFGTDSQAIGRDFLTVDRSVTLSRAVDKALDGKHSDFREERNGGEYQFMITPTESDGNIMGAVILCIDVTESAFAERNRREFTANVSHELKTPLQSIIGSAELLENGLVKPEDTARFIGNIKNEAVRLVALINDIIRLSRLDEGADSELEEVELFEIAKEAADTLKMSAVEHKVTLNLCGEKCSVKGDRRYLYETVYNLCDNAIRYNKPGGSVEIEVKVLNGNAILTVADTGIGIPKEHQSRIFERFYRVDKSHSKETGGTGLGLSIVKHAVAYHGGTVELESEPDNGTRVTVTIPLE